MVREKTSVPTAIPRRLPDWPDRLHEFIVVRWHAPFAWGRHDCLLFAGGAIAAMTGADPFAPAIGLYKTRRQSTAALRAHGYATYADLLRDRLGEPCTGCARAQRGDVVAFDRDDGAGLTTGIAVGTQIAAPGRRGVRLVPMMYGLLYWPVGR